LGGQGSAPDPAEGSYNSLQTPSPRTSPRFGPWGLRLRPFGPC